MRRVAPPEEEHSSYLQAAIAPGHWSREDREKQRLGKVEAEGLRSLGWNQRLQLEYMSTRGQLPGRSRSV